jgi:hypothetical protein
MLNDWGAPLKICRRLKRRLVREVQRSGSLAERIVGDFVTTDELVIFHALPAFVAPIEVFTAKRTKI